MDQSLTRPVAAQPPDAPHAPTHTLRDRLTELRYRWWPDHVLGEILAKRWMETAIPVVVLIGVALALSSAKSSGCSIESPRAEDGPYTLRAGLKVIACWPREPNRYASCTSARRPSDRNVTSASEVGSWTEM